MEEFFIFHTISAKFGFVFTITSYTAIQAHSCKVQIHSVPLLLHKFGFVSQILPHEYWILNSCLNWVRFTNYTQ